MKEGIETYESSHTPAVFPVSWFGSNDLVACLRLVGQGRLTHVSGKSSIRVTWLRPTPLGPPRAISPGSQLHRLGSVYRLEPKTSLFRWMTTGLKAFLEPATHLSFGSCPALHIKKKGHVPYFVLVRRKTNATKLVNATYQVLIVRSLYLVQ